MATERSVLGFYSDRQGKKFREFSNFYMHRRPFRFVLPAFARRDGVPASIWCEFSEKAIMATKAALMGDLESFRSIEKSADPKSCKALGRGVRGFDEELWQAHLEEVAFEVVRQKFASEEPLRQLLLSTGGAIIAEAAPNDAVWGIGLPLSDPRVKDPDQWCGRNILGYALMRAQEHLAADLDVETRAGAVEPPSAVDLRAKAAEDVEIRADTTGEDKEGAAPPVGRRRRWGSAVTPSTARSPAAPADRIDCFAVLDFEATCDSPGPFGPQEVIELPIVLVCPSSRTPVSEFRTYVRPVLRSDGGPVQHPELTAFCRELTGIEQGLVDTAPAWPEALAQAEAWLDAQIAERGFRRCVFATCGDWDLKTMVMSQCATSGQQVPERFRTWLNVKRLFSNTTGKRAHGMASMLEELGLTLDGRHHSGLDDSRNIAKILMELLRRGGKVNEALLSRSPLSRRPEMPSCNVVKQSRISA